MSSRCSIALRELFLEVVAADDRVAHLGREDGEAPLAALLGLVHGDVGVAQELVGGGAVALGGGDADRQRHVERLLAGLHGREEASSVRSASSTAPCSTCSSRCTSTANSSPPRRATTSSLRTERTSRDGDAAQQLVADRVAERVVDALEVVEVDEHHGDLVRAARLERLAHALGEQGAVGEPGQRVVVGLMGELVLQVAQLGDGLLEAVELQRGGRVGGQRLEQRAVAVGEAAGEPVAVGEHERADHAVLAAQDAEHAVADAALGQVGADRAPGERVDQRDGVSEALGELAQRVGGVVVHRRHRLAGAARAEPGAQRRAAVAGEEDDLGLLGAEGLQGALEQALEGDRDLGRLRQRPVGLVEELDLLVALALVHVGAVAEEGDEDRDAAAAARPRGARSTGSRQTSAIAVPVSVTTKSMPNIWRTWSRETWPSVSTIAARIWAIVSTPPSWVASSTEPQVSQPKPSSTCAATCTTTSITVSRQRELGDVEAELDDRHAAQQRARSASRRRSPRRRASRW